VQDTRTENDLRQRRLSWTQQGNYTNDYRAASHSETRIDDYRDSRDSAPDGTESSTPADPAPDEPHEVFVWYNKYDGNAATNLYSESKGSSRTATSSRVVYLLRSPPCRNQRYYRKFTWPSFACANDISSQNMQRVS
jgi:hypothetical protein